jgi:hypothetical protein
LNAELESGPLGTGVVPQEELDRPPVKRMRYSHEALADLIISNPFCDGLWLSLKTGYSRSWLSTIMASDAFQAKLAERREKVVDPTLRLTLEEQAKGLFARSIEVLRHKFDGASENIPDQLAIQTFSATARALGYGNRPEPQSNRDEVTDHLIRHADNLVTLLRREKARARTEEIIDVIKDTDASVHTESAGALSRSAEGRSTTGEVQPEVPGS